MSQVKVMANRYSDYYWKKIVNYTKETPIKIEGIPQDIVNVLDALIGEQVIEWVDRKLPLLDNETARNLVKTEEGYKALKEMIMRMPC